MGSPSDITIPPSSLTVSVQAFDIFADGSSIATTPFLDPVLPGRDVMVSPAYAFLITHRTGQRIMFDLGARKDADGWAPALKAGLASYSHFDLKVDKDIVEQLTEGGVALESIDTVIWRLL
ncbi:hypothetical protein PM082_011547 [Marasmius tenuissimus]|nr:hypothetical protein PM082_011547 [Marasmius tenuissimus]